MTEVAELTPSHFEAALKAGYRAVLDIDVDAIRRMRDPWQTSAAHLPYLAWGRGVDLWFEDWPEHRKRRITAEIYKLKGQKGTLPGLQAYLSYVDATVEESVLPPVAVVARPYDPERLRQFNARFPELRLYTFQQRGGRLGTVAAASGTAPSLAVARTNAAARSYGRRAVLVDKGQTTELRSAEQIRIGGDGIAVPVTSFAITTTLRRSDVVAGSSVPGRVTAHAGRGRLILIGGSTAAGAAVPAGFTGVQVLDVAPERVFERHAGSAAQPVGKPSGTRPAGQVTARLNVAERHIFDRWRLYDADRAGSDPARVFGPVVGRMIPQLSAYTAQLRVNAQFRLAGRSTAPGRAVSGRVVAKHPSDTIERVGAAIYRARALRDDVKFTTRTYRPRSIADLSFSQPQPFGGLVPINRRSA